MIKSDYASSLTFFRKVRDWSDGITFFNLEVNWDKYLSDHSPYFRIRLTVLNHILIEFEIYYKYHRDEDGNKIERED